MVDRKRNSTGGRRSSRKTQKVETDDEPEVDEYEVEEILGRRMYKGTGRSVHYNRTYLLCTVSFRAVPHQVEELLLHREHLGAFGQPCWLRESHGSLPGEHHYYDSP